MFEGMLPFLDSMILNLQGTYTIKLSEDGFLEIGLRIPQGGANTVRSARSALLGCKLEQYASTEDDIYFIGKVTK